MNKPIKLSQEATVVLERLTNEQLHLLKKITGEKEYAVLKHIVSVLIDYEKNQFFSEDESKYENSIWQARHAYSRGGIAKIVLFLKILMGSDQELQRREKIRKEQK